MKEFERMNEMIGLIKNCFTQTNSATVTIAKREVTLTSGSATKVYDGSALKNENVTVDGDGFVAGEDATFNVTDAAFPALSSAAPGCSVVLSTRRMGTRCSVGTAPNGDR